MRRNVRRLNREVGNIGATREPIQEVHHEDEADRYDNGMKKHTKSRKAVNLAGISSLKLSHSTRAPKIFSSSS